MLHINELVLQDISHAITFAKPFGRRKGDFVYISFYKYMS